MQHVLQNQCDSLLFSYGVCSLLTSMLVLSPAGRDTEEGLLLDFRLYI